MLYDHPDVMNSNWNWKKFSSLDSKNVFEYVVEVKKQKQQQQKPGLV